MLPGVPAGAARAALVLALLAAGQALAQPKLPADVARFVERRDLCDHFRGEEPYDAERRRFLERNTREYCVGTDRQLAALKRKYRQNKALMEKLEGYEALIESAPAK